MVGVVGVVGVPLGMLLGVLLTVVGVLLAAAPAHADPSRPRRSPSRVAPESTPPADTLWGRVVRPADPRLDELLSDGRRFLDLHHAARALPLLEEAALRAPASAEAHYWLGRAHLLARQYADCARELDVAFALDPDFRPKGRGAALGDVELGRSRCLAAVGRHGDAARMLASFADDSGLPADLRANALLGLGDIYQAQGRLDEAVVSYRTAGALVGRARDARAHRLAALADFGLAIAHDRDGSAGHSEAALMRALAVDPQLNLLTAGTTQFMPEVEEDFARALAYAFAHRALRDTTARPCAPALCRQLARVHLGRYVDRAVGSPWLRRARELVESLGGAALEARDVTVQTAVPKSAAAWVAALVAGSAPLAACLADQPHALMAVELHLVARTDPRTDTRPDPRPDPRPQGGTVADAPSPPRLLVTSVGPVVASPSATACVRAAVETLVERVAVRGVWLHFAVAAPPPPPPR